MIRGLFGLDNGTPTIFYVDKNLALKGVPVSPQDYNKAWEIERGKVVYFIIIKSHALILNPEEIEHCKPSLN